MSPGLRDPVTTALTPQVPQFWERTEEALGASLPYFVPRPQQAALTALLYDGLRTSIPTAVEAQVGSGKSYSALTTAQELHGRTVITTATRALQFQYADKDIPTLQDLGILSQNVAVLFGRQNYLCARRVKAFLDEDPQPVARRILKELEKLPVGHSGLRERLPVGVPDWIWDRVRSDADVCRAQGCDSMDCAYAAARDFARIADIVVVNHHVLLADAAIKSASAVAWGRRSATPDEPEKPAVLGPYRNLIVDEAHAIESAAESFGEREVTVRGIQALLTRVRKFPGGGAVYLEDAADKVAKVIESLPQEVLLDAVDDGPVLLGAANRAKEARAAIRQAVSDGLADPVDGDVLASLCTGLADRLEAIDSALRTGEDEIGPRAVSAYEGRIKSQLVDAGPWLQHHVWDQVRSALISGTLTVPGRAGYVTERAGLPVPVTVLPPVFDLESQRLVYVTPRADNGGGARVGDADIEELLGLLRASNGRALVLFPANQDLRYTYEAIANIAPHTVYGQGVTPAEEPRPTRKRATGRTRTKAKAKKFSEAAMPNAELARRFHEDTHSILLATRSFFEGVDFPGDTCSLVVVARFPNLRPDDPLTAARCRKIQADGGNAWSGYQEPAMQILFRQAVGRAVRRIDDKGVVAVLDPRSGSKQYAKRALLGLKPSDYTDSLYDVEKFLS